MLLVLSVSDIKFTKLKPYSIHFKCGDKMFLLHGSSDGGESVVRLYEVNLNKYGNYVLSSLSSVYSLSDNVRSMFVKDYKRGKTCSQLSVSSFVAKLSDEGLGVCSL